MLRRRVLDGLGSLGVHGEILHAFAAMPVIIYWSRKDAVELDAAFNRAADMVYPATLHAYVMDNLLTPLQIEVIVVHIK